MGQGSSAMERGDGLVDQLEETQQVTEENLVTLPSVLDSSEEEEGVSDLGDRTFQNILAVLVGRNSLSLSSPLGRRRVADTSSDSEDSEQEMWRYRPQPAPPTPRPPDTSNLLTSEITTLTNLALHPTTRGRGRVGQGLPGILAHRSLGNTFTSKDKVRVGGRLLPHNPSRVAKYKNKVFCGTYAREGDLFMTACQDQKIRLYDTSRGHFTLKQTFQARDVGWSVLDVVVSPDGRHLVYSSWSDNLHQVSLLDDQIHEALPLNPDDRQFCIFSVSFSQDSRELLGGANDGYLYLYDRSCNTQSLRVESHEDDVNAVCFVDETTHILASGGDDGLVKVWDRRSLREDDPRPVGVLAGHVDGVTFVDPRGDGRHMISNSKDQSIKLWDVRKFSAPSAVNQGRKAVSNQRWDYRWQRVPKSGGLTKKKVDGDSSVMTYTGHTVLQTLIRCHFSPKFTTGQRYIYTGCAAGRVVIYELLTGKIVKVLQGHESCVRDVSWHPFKQEICSSSWDYTVNRWHGVDAGEEEDERMEEEKETQYSGSKRKNKMGGDGGCSRGRRRGVESAGADDDCET